MLLNGKEIKEYASEMLVRDVLEAEGMDMNRRNPSGSGTSRFADTDRDISGFGDGSS